MQIVVQSENAFARKLRVEVPSERVDRELERSFDRLLRTSRIPGFRPGKAPRKVLEARFGASVQEDVANNLIQAAWTTALTQHKLQPVSQPRLVEPGNLASGKAFSFTIALEVRPSIEAKGYTGLDVAWPSADLAPTMVDQAIDARLQSQTRLAEVTGRAVEAGDVVNVEIACKDGADVVHEAPGTLVRTNGDVWLKGLESSLLGLKIGKSFKGDITFAEDARTEAVAGKTLAVVAKVLAIQAYVKPALDEAFAKELGFDTVEALRADVERQLSEGLADQARNHARANLLQALIAANSFDVPNAMVAENLQLLQEELRMQAAYSGRDPRSLTFSEAQLADLRQRAAFAARGAILLESVAKLESITVTDADVEAKIEELGSGRGQNIESVRAYFADAGRAAELKDRILEEKTLDWLLDRANVTRGAAEASAEAPASATPAAAKKPAAKKKAAEAAVEGEAAEAAPAKKPAAKKKAAEAAVEGEAVEAAPAKKPAKKKATDA
ncbi:MAG: Trigger factor [Pseudomonadota bacterium]